MRCYLVLRSWALLVTVSVLAAHSNAESVNFEQFYDAQPVTSQISGLTFGNAIALQAGLTLNEFEFPPKSGTVVLSDDGGAMSILFSVHVLSFSGYFTYLVGLKVTAFDDAGTVIATANSAFGSNLLLSGDTGSSPNELISMAYGGGIRRVQISGAATGQSFVLDDLSYTFAATVPEPSSRTLIMFALIASACASRGIRSKACALIGKSAS
jgi:hypothetical protein